MVLRSNVYCSRRNPVLRPPPTLTCKKNFSSRVKITNYIFEIGKNLTRASQLGLPKINFILRHHYSKPAHFSDKKKSFQYESNGVKSISTNNATSEKDPKMTFEEQLTTLSKNLETVVPADGLAEKIKGSIQTQTPLRIKFGLDPTAPDLHLGHAVILKKIAQFQEFGHKVVIIIGDFTAYIGDPTGRNKTRPPLTQDEIQANSETYLSQLSKVIDVSKAEVRFNSEWLNKMNLQDMIKLVSKLTLSQILQREDFNNRYKNNIPIHFHELIYPMIQGYDSIMINSDIEMGGTDQLFNCLVGRDLQSIFHQKPQIVACAPILKGTDGYKKMSKSLKNYIGLTEDPNSMYGKIMSIPDGLIEEYVRLLSTFPPKKIDTIHKLLLSHTENPMRIKKELAHDIVKQFHGAELANKSADFFYKQVQSRDEELIEFKSFSLSQLNLTYTNINLLSLCCALLSEKSKGEIKRLIQNGGVTVNSQKITNPHQIIKEIISSDFKIKIGKRNFYEIKIS